MIKFLVMDVDGTLTDGKIYMSAGGELIKAFDIKDGYAMHTLLREHGIIPIIITARNSLMVENRCKELGVKEIHQGVMNKLDCLKGILKKHSSERKQYDLSNVAYIGDDLLDLQCMLPIKEAGGVIGCPSNAVKELIAVSDYVAPHKGGDGAIRDFSEYLFSRDKDDEEQDLDQRCMRAVEYLNGLDVNNLSLGKHIVNANFFYNVLEYETTCEDNKPFESHCKNVDIQFLLSGEEIMQVADITRLQVITPYNSIEDTVLYSPKVTPAKIVLRPGSVMILFQRDAHRSMALNGKRCKVKKIVGKLSLKKQ